MVDPLQWVKDTMAVLKESGRVDLSAQILELMKANTELERRLMELEARVRLREDMTWRGNAYWTKGEPSEGPYCSRCADVDHKSVRMHDRRGYWKCPQCPISIK